MPSCPREPSGSGRLPASPARPTICQVNGFHRQYPFDRLRGPRHNRRMDRAKHLMMALLLLGFTPACDDSEDDGGEETGGDGDEEVSLRSDLMPWVGPKCGFCHTRVDTPAPDAVVNMVYFEEAGDMTGLVGTFITAGDSANSGLVNVMAGEFPVGSGPTTMPPPDAPVDAPTEDELQMLRDWIDQGAQDN